MEKEKKIRIIGVLVITIILLVSAIVVVSSLLEEETSETEFTTSFSGITAAKAYEIITNNENVYLVDDPDSCHCRYDTEHIGNPPDFEAILVNDYKILPNGIKTLYNTTNITIIYDDGGGDAIDSCRLLVNHTYAPIYYIEGGLDAWKAEGLPIVKQI